GQWRPRQWALGNIAVQHARAALFSLAIKSGERPAQLFPKAHNANITTGQVLNPPVRNGAH
ncbi:MAG: hypothetical protein ACI9W2_002247, partial [Gammaproteobacteria bacterium]